jgi:hypothetical protein
MVEERVFAVSATQKLQYIRQAWKCRQNYSWLQTPESMGKTLKRRYIGWWSVSILLLSDEVFLLYKRVSLFRSVCVLVTTEKENTKTTCGKGYVVWRRAFILPDRFLPAPELLFWLEAVLSEYTWPANNTAVLQSCNSFRNQPQNGAGESDQRLKKDENTVCIRFFCRIPGTICSLWH